MAKKVTYSFEIDKKLKKRCEKICESLGLDFPAALNLFAIRLAQNNGLPFKVEGNKLTKEAVRAVVDLEGDETDLKSGCAESQADFLLAKFSSNETNV